MRSVEELLRAEGRAMAPLGLALRLDIPVVVVHAAIDELTAQGRVRPGRPGTVMAVAVRRRKR